MLRFVSPVTHFRRTATKDAELRGRQISEGDWLVLFYGAGNRDPAVFPDPDRFDVTRHPNPHIAFGEEVPTSASEPHWAVWRSASCSKSCCADSPTSNRPGPRPGYAETHPGYQDHAGSSGRRPPMTQMVSGERSGCFSILEGPPVGLGAGVHDPGKMLAEVPGRAESASLRHRIDGQIAHFEEPLSEMDRWRCSH